MNAPWCDRLYFLVLQNHCRWWLQPWIKRRLLLRRKVMINLDSILKSRDITLPTKVHLVKAMIFPVVLYGCESWTMKKAEHWRIDAFELWCWRRLLRVPWTARRSNQSILKEISPRCSLEGLMLKLKLQYFGHLMQRDDTFEKTLLLGKIEGGRRRGRQRMRWLDDITDSVDMSLSKLWSWWWTGRPGVLPSMGSRRVGHDWATELNWTDIQEGSQIQWWMRVYAVQSTHPSSNGSYFLHFNGSYEILVFYCPRQWSQSYYGSRNKGVREREFFHPWGYLLWANGSWGL